MIGGATANAPPPPGDFGPITNSQYKEDGILTYVLEHKNGELVTSKYWQPKIEAYDTSTFQHMSNSVREYVITMLPENKWTEKKIGVIRQRGIDECVEWASYEDREHWRKLQIEEGAPPETTENYSVSYDMDFEVPLNKLEFGAVIGFAANIAIAESEHMHEFAISAVKSFYDLIDGLVEKKLGDTTNRKTGEERGYEVEESK
jgi:hypothetical protein